jgi:putative signal transducing protein
LALSSDITIESAGWRGKGIQRLTRHRVAVAGPAEESDQLRELVRTNDIVLVSAVGALLDGANIHHLVLDQNMSIIEGSLGVLPRRILVHEDDNREARQILSDAGLAHELRADD